MFAYCGNNPVNCSDPGGNIYRSFHWQIDYLFFEGFGGIRSAGTSGSIQEAANDFLLESAKSAGFNAITMVAPKAAAGIAVYRWGDRFLDYSWRGASVPHAFGIATIETLELVVSAPQQNTKVKQIVADHILSSFLDVIKSELISDAFSKTESVNRNQSNFRRGYSGALIVGGSMKYCHVGISDWSFLI